MGIFIFITLIVFIILILILIIIIPLNNKIKESPFKSYNKGQQGEEEAKKLLEEISKEINDSYLINNVYIPSYKDRNGNLRTIEIDHLLITRSGIFVIETKSRSGVIYGNELDDNWTQVLGYENEIKHTFFNPIKQNDTHIRVLKRVLRQEKLQCFSCILFIDGDISNIESDLVFNKMKLKEYIFDQVEEIIYDKEFVFSLFNRINYYKEHPVVSKEDHIKEIHKHHG